MPKDISSFAGTRASNEDAAYHDTGKTFTVSTEDLKQTYRGVHHSEPPEGITYTTSNYVLPQIMMSKVYGFSGQFVAGWMIQWTKENEEGYIGTQTAKYWHVKRVL